MSCEVQSVYLTWILPTKLVAVATSLKRSGKITSDVHLRPEFYKSCKFREDRFGRCWDNWFERNHKSIIKKYIKQQQNISHSRRGGGLTNDRNVCPVYVSFAWRRHSSRQTASRPNRRTDKSGSGIPKNVLVFDPLLTGHVIRRMRSGRVRIFNGNQLETLSVITHKVFDLFQNSISFHVV